MSRRKQKKIIGCRNSEKSDIIKCEICSCADDPGECTRFLYRCHREKFTAEMMKDGQAVTV